MSLLVNISYGILLGILPSIAVLVIYGNLKNKNRLVSVAPWALSVGISYTVPIVAVEMLLQVENISSLKIIYGVYAFTIGLALFVFTKKHFPEYWNKEQDNSNVVLSEEDKLTKLGHLLIYFTCLNLSWMWVSYKITKLPVLTYYLLGVLSVAFPLLMLALMVLSFLKKSDLRT